MNAFILATVALASGPMPWLPVKVLVQSALCWCRGCSLRISGRTPRQTAQDGREGSGMGP